jgi:hypothetical protein
VLDSFNDGLKQLDTYLKDPKHQQQIRDFIDKLENGFKDFGKKIDKVDNILDKLGLGDDDAENAKSKSSSIGSDIGKALVSGLIAGIGQAAQESAERFLGYFILGPSGGSLIDQLREKLGIHSPSTVMAEIGHDLIDGLMQGIGDKFKDLQDKAGQIKDKVVTGLGNAGTWLTNHGKSAVAGLQTGMSTAYAGLKTTAGNAKTTVTNALSTAGSWLKDHGTNVVSGLRNGMSNQYGNLQSTASTMRTRVSNGLSDAYTLLGAAGKNLVNGLINGISSKLSDLGNFLGQVGAFIQAHKGPPSKDRVLLFEAGQLIMGSLIGGIGDKEDALAAKLADVSSLISVGVDDPTIGIGAQTDAIAKSLSVSSRQQVEFSWKNSPVVDPLMRVLQDHIGITYNGDPIAAFGG